MATMRVTLFLNEKEQEMVKELMGRYGGKTPSVFKRLLIEKYDKMFPAYRTIVKRAKAIKEDEPKLTPEQQCEAMGGEIINGSGGAKSCRIITFQNKAGQESIDLELNERALTSYSKKYMK